MVPDTINLFISFLHFTKAGRLLIVRLCHRAYLRTHGGICTAFSPGSGGRRHYYELYEPTIQLIGKRQKSGHTAGFQCLFQGQPPYSTVFHHYRILLFIRKIFDKQAVEPRVCLCFDIKCQNSALPVHLDLRSAILVPVTVTAG